MENDKKNVLLIVNPCAGRTKSRAGIFDIVNKFSTNDYKFSVRTTTCRGDATNIVKKELGNHDLVVCCGGDGTLNETINGVMDMPRRVPIGYVPCGTTNDLASTLGIPKDIGKAVDLIMSGKTNDYDIGLFNNRYFSYVASFGICSAASYKTPQKLKNIFGHSAYIVAGVLDVRNAHAVHMKIEYDDGIIEDDFYFGTVSNSTSVGGFFNFNRDDVKLNDGKFELLLVRKFPLVNIFHIVSRVRHQQYDGHEIVLLRTKKVKIHCDNEAVDWTLDGEYGGAHRDVRINVLEKAIDICSPENDLFLKPEPKPFEPEPKPEKEGFFSRKKKSELKDEAEEIVTVTEVTENEAEVEVIEVTEETVQEKPKKKQKAKRQKKSEKAEQNSEKEEEFSQSEEITN